MKHLLSRSKKALIFGVFALIGSFLPSQLRAQCNPVTATLYASADDLMVVYINGTPVSLGGAPATMAYVNAPGVLPAYGIPGSYFLNGTNIVAVEDINTTMSVVEGAWTIDITCSGGVSHAYFSNTDPGYMIYNDTTGTTPPGNDPSSNPWYSTPYAAATSQVFFTTPPVTVTSPAPYLQVMYNPQTGQIQPWTSINTAGSSSTANQVLYFRGSFNLNTVAYSPPTFSIQKIPGFSSFPSSYSGPSEPYTRIVCNSGAPINTPVTIWDQFMNGGGSYPGPNNSYNNPPGNLYNIGGSNPVLFEYPLGFGGNGYCVTLVAAWAYWDSNNGSPCSITNSAGVSWGGASQPSTSVSVPVNTGCGPTNTFTSTPTPSRTYTPTISPTFTNTFTATNTFTLQFTATNTPTRTPSGTPTLTGTPTFTGTPSATPTVTPTRTASYTPTNSATVTPTRTPTNTATVTMTRTPTSTPTITYTPTITPTPTATVPDTDIFYVSKNAFDPANGPVSINVQYTKFPGDYRFWIYNSAGEHILTLASQTMTQPINASYIWDGKNKYGDKCASGIYVLYLVEPYSRKMKRLLLLR